MKIEIANREFVFDLKTDIGQRSLIDNLLVAYRKKFAFFTNLLISISEIKNVEESFKDSLAYTKLNIDTERFDIFINFEMIE